MEFNSVHRASLPTFPWQAPTASLVHQNIYLGPSQCLYLFRWWFKVLKSEPRGGLKLSWKLKGTEGGHEDGGPDTLNPNPSYRCPSRHRPWSLDGPKCLEVLCVKALGCRSGRFSRWGILNVFLTYDIFNLRWFYWDITPSKSTSICIKQQN